MDKETDADIDVNQFDSIDDAWVELTTQNIQSPESYILCYQEKDGSGWSVTRCDGGIWTNIGLFKTQEEAMEFCGLGGK